ncbi:hypothetical protein ACLI09_15745 [Flavobacterium sp. RHBU_24]|uniref:hypothetical protein n=1 Tax=Flavobacterium sp. RHBU_24 TaxID=3391185 RepID=UPI00398506ED
MRSVITLLLAFTSNLLFAQDIRVFTYNGHETQFAVYSNRKNGDVKLPGYNVSIIMGDKDQELSDIFQNDTLKNGEAISMVNFSYFYYIPYQESLDENSLYAFLDAFIRFNHDADYFDRNRVFLYLNSKAELLSCKALDTLNEIVAAIVVPPDNPLLGCSPLVFNSDVPLGDIKKRSMRTTKQYEVVTLDYIAQKDDTEKTNREAKIWNNQLFGNFTLGYHWIRSGNRTAFDEETLIDFSKINTYYNLTAGYYINNWSGLFLNFGFVISGKEKGIKDVRSNVDGSVTLSGSGKGAAAIKLGLGLRLIPFKKDRLTTYADISLNNLSAIAGGGEVTRTIGGSGTNTTDTTKKKEKAVSYDLAIGATYRVTRSFSFLGNFQYEFSKFDRPIGSVNGFGGMSVNLGIGFSFGL